MFQICLVNRAEMGMMQKKDIMGETNIENTAKRHAKVLFEKL